MPLPGLVPRWHPHPMRMGRPAICVATAIFKCVSLSHPWRSKVTTRVRGKPANQREIAQIMGVSVVTIRTWEKEGLPSVSKSGKGIPGIYDSRAVIDWFARRTAPSGDA